MNTHPISGLIFLEIPGNSLQRISCVLAQHRPIFSTIRLVVFILDQGAELNQGECTVVLYLNVFLSKGFSCEGFSLKCVYMCECVSVKRVS